MNSLGECLCWGVNFSFYFHILFTSCFLQSPQIIILKGVCWFIVLLLSSFCIFFHFFRGFAFAFAKFVRYCVVLLKALLSYGDKKESCKPLWAKISHFSLEGLKPLLSKFIGYMDLTNFHQILSKHSRNNEKQKCVGKFWYLKYLSHGVHLCNTPHISLATPTLDANTEYRKRLTHFHWLMPCE